MTIYFDKQRTQNSFTKNLTMDIGSIYIIFYLLEFSYLLLFLACIILTRTASRTLHSIGCIVSCIALIFLGLILFYFVNDVNELTNKTINIKSSHEASTHDQMVLIMENKTENISVIFKNISSSIDKRSPTTKTVNSDREFFAVSRNVPNITCSALFEGDTEEKERASKEMFNSRPRLSETEYQVMIKYCDIFKARRRYITSPLTKEEEDFPIAFSIVTYKDIEQTERLLRAIYRPQNYYCIHVDKKSEEDFRHTLHGIADCFDNVFISSMSVDVEWGTVSVLEAGLSCLKDLVKKYKNWKYFINLTGQEFPLRTNLQLVKILTIYNGANDVEGTVERANPERWLSAGKPPHGIIPIKGSQYVAVNRKFAEYAVYDKVALDFLNWTMHTDIPEETYYASLNHNPHLGIPGSYKGVPETDKDKKPFLARFVNWKADPFNWTCEGQQVRGVCVFGVGDLPLLRERPEMFANKFYQDYQPLTLDCMEELIYNRTRDEYLHKYEFDSKIYKSLDFIKNKV